MGQIREEIRRDSRTKERLLALWESAVVETHTFLSREDIQAIRPEVMQALREIERLYCFWEDDEISGFLGVAEDKIEMLFVGAEFRGKGVGKELLEYAVRELGTRYVDVNEQNLQGVGFYLHLGFQVMERSELDEQGRPFPILHLVRG